MKYLLMWLVFLSLNAVLGQNMIKHKVAKGETIKQISKKYNVSLPDIYKMNPDAQKGIQENTLLLIPNKAVAKKEAPVVKTEPKTPAYVSHEVAPKETLYGIAKQY